MEFRVRIGIGIIMASFSFYDLVGIRFVEVETLAAVDYYWAAEPELTYWSRYCVKLYMN